MKSHSIYRGISIPLLFSERIVTNLLMISVNAISLSSFRDSITTGLALDSIYLMVSTILGLLEIH